MQNSCRTIADPAETSDLRKFFSLKWKVIIVTSIVLSIINIILSSINYANLLDQFEDQKTVAYQQYTKEIEALISRSLQHMQQVSDIIPALTYTESGEDIISGKNLISTLDHHWSTLLFNMGINAIYFYDTQNQLIIEWGETDFNEDNAYPTSTWIGEINNLERPRTLIDCTSDCIQYVATPILSQGEKAGVLLVESSLADIILDFKQMSGIDIGILTVNESRNVEGDKSRILPSWEAKIIALTSIDQNMPVLQKLAKEYPEISHLVNGKRYSVGESFLKVTLIPFKDFDIDFKGQGFLILMEDITKSLADIKSARKQTLWMGGIGFLFSEILLLALLWNPLSRLHRIALHLPLLAENKFREARDAIHKEYRGAKRKDEVDVLTDTAVKLSYRLENLAGTLAEHIDELSHERDFIKRLLDTAQAIVMVQNKLGEITLVNHYGSKSAMYDVDEFVGKKLSDFLLNDEMAVGFEEDLSRILSGEVKQLSNECVMVCKDGSTRYIAWNHCLLSDKAANDILILSVGLDITDRKEAEVRLCKSEERLRTVFEAADSVSFVTTDLSGKGPKVLDFSPGAERIFGCEREKAIGKPLVMFHLPKDVELIGETCQSVKKDKAVVRLQLDLVRKSGEEFPAILTTYPVLDAGGNAVHALWVSFDISEIRKLELQLRHSQKMEAIGILAGGIAHDFNNMLQSISGYTQLLLMEKNKDSKDYSKLSAIDVTVNKAAILTKQLLIFSRNIESELKPIDLNHEIRQVCEILKRTLPKMIDIELDLESNLKTVDADSVQLEQIMMNIAINGRDVMTDGGRLTFKTRNVILNEEYCKTNIGVDPGEYVEVSISDTGHGMSKETQEHIFEPFFTTKGPDKGTGLGLAMVYGIVKNHLGHISCCSQLDKGTTFHIYFPVSETKNGICKAEDVLEERLTGGNETILLVEDEIDILKIEKELLSQFGYNVISAENGEEAVHIYDSKEHRIDLVILDLNMPGMGGHRCLLELKKIDPGAKVIIASGYHETNTAQATAEQYSEGFISKPFRLSDFLKRIRDVLDS